MPLSHAQYYRAFADKDKNYDGKFFVGVTSTGIYCRPICTARLPKESNCKFFPDRSAAEREGFRACKRCRPELALGAAPVDDTKRVAELFAQRLDDGTIHLSQSIEDIAHHFELSARQFRRIISSELGLTPLQYLKEKRLDRAKALLSNKRLPIIKISEESGFSSLRSFNEAFAARFGQSPSNYRSEL